MLLIGAIIGLAIVLLGFALAYFLGVRALEPATPSEEKKTFPTLKFGDMQVDQRIVWKDRPPKAGLNTMCQVLIYGLLAGQLVLCVVVIASANTAFVMGSPCPEGYVPDPTYPNDGPRSNHFGLCVNDGLFNDMRECNGNRRLELAEGETVQHGRILYSQAGGVLTTEVRHDLWSALAMAQGQATRRGIAYYGELRSQAKAYWHGERHLQQEGNLDTSTDMFGAFESYPEVPAVLLAGLVVLVPLWIAALRLFTKQVVWGTLVLDLGMLIYLLIRTEFSPAFIVLTVIFLVVVFLCRKKIQTAVEILKLATQGLTENPRVFLACAVVFLMYAAYVVAWELAMISSAGVMEVYKDDGGGDGSDLGNFLAAIGGGRPSCKLRPMSMIENVRSFLIVMFVPTTFFFMNVKLVVCATGLGAWYLHSDDPQKPKNPAFVGLKWGLVDCAGPTFLSALMQYAIHSLRKVAKNWSWWTSPVGCALRIVWCMVENCLMCFTKLMLIGHIFHGGALIPTARKSFAVLKNHLGTALVTDSVAHQVTSWSTAVVCVGLGFVGTVWMENQVGVGVFRLAFGAAGAVGEADSEAGAGLTEVLIVGFGILFLYVAGKPLMMLVVVIGFIQGPVNSATNHALGLFTGIFMAAIGSIVFTFVGQIVHNSTDVIMYCYALEQECGKSQERFGNLYDTMKKNVVAGTPAAGGAVAMGTEVPKPKFDPQTGERLDQSTGEAPATI